jgi:hypothetical protein
MMTNLHTPDNDAWVDHLTSRWVEATIGGRLITSRVARFVEGAPAWILESMAQSDQVWRANIDTIGGWHNLVRFVRREDAQTYPQPFLSIVEAEAMMSWPIYQEALRSAR